MPLLTEQLYVRICFYNYAAPTTLDERVLLAEGVPTNSTVGWPRQEIDCRATQIWLSSGVSKSQRFLIYWLPLLVWMCVIFTASDDKDSTKHSSRFFEPLMHWLFPTMSHPHVEQIHYAFRKCCHMAEYAILAVLAWRAIRQPLRNDVRPWRWDEAGLALAIALLYAASDELHQVFIPSRTGQISDVLVDVIGGAAGLLLLRSAGKFFKRW